MKLWWGGLELRGRDRYRFALEYSISTLITVFGTPKRLFESTVRGRNTGLDSGKGETSSWTRSVVLFCRASDPGSVSHDLDSHRYIFLSASLDSATIWYATLSICRVLAIAPES
jgi:hypothetical protein